MKQPNVVIIMSDQHHPRFMGCAGNAIVGTPAMDALAARGTRMEHAYCASPLCGPSRMAFMSGQMPSSIGCLDNSRQLHGDTLTFAHMFAVSGYETVLAGRMHFNGPDQRHGFNRRLISDITSYVHRPDREMMAELLPDGPWYTGPSVQAIQRSGPGQCSYELYDQHVARKAADWISERKGDRPFMLTAGFVLPHAPFVCSREDFDTYDALVGDEDLPPWQDQTHPELVRFQTKSGLLSEPRISRKDQRRARVAYYGMCASLDRQVKLITDAIAAAGLTQDTIIVYTSDHGEQLGEHGLWWKHTFYEGSVGVPMIFAGPGVPQGQNLSQNVSLIDLGQTLLDMTGSQLNPTAEGKSFASLFKGQVDSWDDTVLAENLWPPGADCLGRMIKQGRWKLNHYPGHAPQLFNLQDDPGENHDLANDPAYADIRSQLTARVIEGWDHDAIMAGQKQYLTAQPILRHARDNSDQPEPDRAWLRDLKIKNYVDTSR